MTKNDPKMPSTKDMPRIVDVAPLRLDTTF
jgi:hypothetical protein